MSDDAMVREYDGDAREILAGFRRVVREGRSPREIEWLIRSGWTTPNASSSLPGVEQETCR